jgi:hypothetical protein
MLVTVNKKTKKNQQSQSMRSDESIDAPLLTKNRTTAHLAIDNPVNIGVVACRI